MQCSLCQAELPAGQTSTICAVCQQLVTGSTKGEGLSMPALWTPTTKAPVPREMLARQVAKGVEIWRATSGGDLRLTSPMSIAVTTSGDILVLDQPEDYRVLKLDAQGRIQGVVMTIPFGAESGALEDPQGLAVDRDGRIYVPDAASDQIHVWSAEGRFLRAFGSSGNTPGRFAHPCDVDVDTYGFIFIADTFNRRVQKLSPDGIVSLIITQLGPWGRLEEPAAVTTDASGNIYIGDRRTDAVYKVSPDGQPLMRLPQEPSEPALFEDIGDVRIGRDGGIYVSDQRNLRIRRFDEEGAVTGEIDLTREDSACVEGGDIALWQDHVLLPDRMQDNVLCMALN
jgi:DNA-binding beta-propeller fold protein YncE